MEKLVIKNNVVIRGGALKVWDALVNPEKTKKYMFGCETVSDWKTGSPLLWKGSYEGKEIVYVKGTISAIQPCKFLKYTVFDPNSSMPDIPENYLNVTYELSEQDGDIDLIVTQDGFETAADGEKRYKDSYKDGKGWDPILFKIKELVESE